MATTILRPNSAPLKQLIVHTVNTSVLHIKKNSQRFPFTSTLLSFEKLNFAKYSSIANVLTELCATLTPINEKKKEFNKSLEGKSSFYYYKVIKKHNGL